MSSRKYSLIALLLVFISILTGIASITGVFFRGDMKSAEVTSVRGEKYEMIIDGIYKYNSKRMVAEGVGWDIFTLFIVLPCLLIVIPSLAKGSQKARLFTIGLLAYLFYQYFMYSLAWAFGPLFLLFILIYALCLWGIIWITGTVDIKELEKNLKKKFPIKSIIALSIFLGLLLSIMWLQRIIAGLKGDLNSAMLLGQTTMVVQAMDLGLLVPLSIYNAYLLWKKKTLGYFISSIIVIKAVAMAGAICAMVIMAWITEKQQQIAPLAIFSIVGIIATYLGFKIYKNV